MEETKERIVVKTSLESAVMSFIVVVILCLLMMVVILGDRKHSKVTYILVIGFFILLMLGMGIYIVLDYKIHRIIACNHYLYIRNCLGVKRKIGYEEISAVRVEGRRGGTVIKLEAEGGTLSNFSNLDENFTAMMKFLTAKIPDAIVWEKNDLL